VPAERRQVSTRHHAPALYRYQEARNVRGDLIATAGQQVAISHMRVDQPVDRIHIVGGGGANDRCSRRAPP
jgi:hypothetical protein